MNSPPPSIVLEKIYGNRIRWIFGFSFPQDHSLYIPKLICFENVKVDTRSYPFSPLVSAIPINRFIPGDVKARRPVSQTQPPYQPSQYGDKIPVELPNGTVIYVDPDDYWKVILAQQIGGWLSGRDRRILGGALNREGERL